MKRTGLRILSKRTFVFFIFVFAFASAFVLYSQSNNTYIMKTSVLDESGGSLEAADKKMIATSAGQPTPIGVSESPNYRLYAGYIYTLGDDCVITVTFPNGGNVLCAGSQENITWTSQETSGNVSIEYSTNNGSSWQEVIGSTPDDGSYDWTVPSVAGRPNQNCLIRVCDVANPSCCDRSNSSFQICECGTIVILTETLPNGTQNCPYNETLQAEDGCLPYTWSIASGSLPPGLVLEPSTGAISGDPEDTGFFEFTIRVTGGDGGHDDQEVSIQVDEYTNIKGDVDGDCRINVIDIVLLSNCLIFDEECCPDSPDDTDVMCCREDVCPPDDDMMWRADCNGPPGNCDGDGDWNVLDCVKIANIILQIDECP